MTVNGRLYQELRYEPENTKINLEIKTRVIITLIIVKMSKKISDIYLSNATSVIF